MNAKKILFFLAPATLGALTLLSFAALGSTFSQAEEPSTPVPPEPPVVAPEAPEGEPSAERTNFPEFDWSLLEIPEGKDVAFYVARVKEIQSAYRAYLHADRSCVLNRELLTSVERVLNRANVLRVFAPGFDRMESEESESLYLQGLAYTGKVAELQAELDAELDPGDPIYPRAPDEAYVYELETSLDVAKVAKLVLEGQEAELLAQIDAAIEGAIAECDANPGVGEPRVKRTTLNNVPIREKSENFRLLETTPNVLEKLSRDDLYEQVGRRLAERFYRSQYPRLEALSEYFGSENRRKLSVNRQLKLEGVFTDGTEFSWDDYRGKTLLIYIDSAQNGRVIEEQIENIRSTYEVYREAGFEVIAYTMDDNLCEWRRYESQREYPWKTISQALTTQANESSDRELLNFGAYYSLNSLPTMILVGEEGKVLYEYAQGSVLRRGLRRIYPEFVDDELHDLLDVPEGRELDFYRMKLAALKFARPMDQFIAPRDPFANREAQMKRFEEMRKLDERVQMTEEWINRRIRAIIGI